MINLSMLIWNCKFILSYALTFISALLSPRLRLAARLLAAESQLSVLKHRIDQKKDTKPRFSPAFRFLWALLYRFWADWRSTAHLMQPDTVVRWHRRGFRIFWRWKSRKRGRPPVESVPPIGARGKFHLSNDSSVLSAASCSTTSSLSTTGISTSSSRNSSRSTTIPNGRIKGSQATPRFPIVRRHRRLPRTSSSPFRSSAVSTTSTSAWRHSRFS